VIDKAGAPARTRPFQVLFMNLRLPGLCAVICFGLAFSIAVASQAAAADPAAGRKKVAGVCQACHGMDGLSKNPEAPNLAGQIENYLVKAIGEYRSGERENETMNIVAKPLSDEDIADMAAYYASIQFDVVPP
jgi:cytochrome c553